MFIEKLMQQCPFRSNNVLLIQSEERVDLHDYSHPHRLAAIPLNYHTSHNHVAIPLGVLQVVVHNHSIVPKSGFSLGKNWESITTDLSFCP